MLLLLLTLPRESLQAAPLLTQALLLPLLEGNYNYSQGKVQQNNMDVNGAGTQKTPFLHMSSSFSSCHSD